MSIANSPSRPTVAGGDFSHPTTSSEGASEVHFEGDYRPTTDAPVSTTSPNIRVEPLQIDFLQRLADTLKIEYIA